MVNPIAAIYHPINTKYWTCLDLRATLGESGIFRCRAHFLSSFEVTHGYTLRCFLFLAGAIRERQGGQQVRSITSCHCTETRARGFAPWTSGEQRIAQTLEIPSF